MELKLADTVSDDCTGADTLEICGGTETSTILSASCARPSIGVSSRKEANTIRTFAGSL